MRVYVSHSIRGPKGKDATKEDMQRNCERILVVVNRLRKEFPAIDFYVPAEHEDFVGEAYRKKYITEGQILDVDCSIIDECNAVIIYTPIGDSIIQGGRLVEYHHAVATDKLYCIFSSIEFVILWLKNLMGGLNAKSKTNR